LGEKEGCGSRSGRRQGAEVLHPASEEKMMGLRRWDVREREMMLDERSGLCNM